MRTKRRRRFVLCPGCRDKSAPREGGEHAGLECACLARKLLLMEASLDDKIFLRDALLDRLHCFVSNRIVEWQVGKFSWRRKSNITSFASPLAAPGHAKGNRKLTALYTLLRRQMPPPPPLFLDVTDIHDWGNTT